MSVSGLLDFCRSFVSQHNVYDFTGKILEYLQFQWCMVFQQVKQAAET